MNGPIGTTRFPDTLPYHEFRIFSGREMCKIMNEFIGMCGPMTMMWNKLYRAELFKDFRFMKKVAYEDMYQRLQAVVSAGAMWRLFRTGSPIGGSTGQAEHPGIHTRISASMKCMRTRNASVFLECIMTGELYRLALKQMYYIATQHLYLQKRYVKDSRNVQDWLLDKIADIYRELMAMDCWSARTRSRMRFIRRFPEQFGYWACIIRSISAFKEIAFRRGRSCPIFIHILVCWIKPGSIAARSWCMGWALWL